MAQCGKFPIRYIIELLNKQRRIVLTGKHHFSLLLRITYKHEFDFPTKGFSFGGLLASAVAASVWDTPYISSDLLKENMTCITFGQPLVTVDIVHRVAIKRPEMVTTINAIFTKQDQIPSLMGLLDECWSAKAQQTQTKSTPGVQVSVAAVNCGQTMVRYNLYACGTQSVHACLLLLYSHLRIKQHVISYIDLLNFKIFQ